MRVAVVENIKDTSLGQVGLALEEAGADIRWYRPWLDQSLPEEGSYDALVVLGGEQSAIDDHIHPYLPHLAVRMRSFAEAGKSVLGICLGSQVLARAYGATNLVGAAPEFGWQRISLTDEGRSDPVMAELEDGFPIFEWHSDTFTLPEGAAHLAHNDNTRHQAFRVGRAAYGTQFHFEANRQVVADWARDFAATIERLAPGWSERHAELAATDGVAAEDFGLRIARAWVRTIGA